MFYICKGRMRDMGTVKTWKEIYETHPVRKNLTDFLPLDGAEYVFYSPEKTNEPLRMEELLAQRESRGCKYVVIACDNKYALKMFAGVADERQRFFGGLEEDAGNRMVYSKAELEEMMKKAGITEYQFFYPYPNYQLPLAIYSDEYQPKIGELTNNLRNFDVDRAVLFDESKAWDQVIKDGLFTTFANSFLLVIGPEIPWKRGNLLFSKFSNDRAEAFNIRTDIIEENGARLVLKSPVGKRAQTHIKSLCRWYEKLSKAYPKVQFNHCEKGEDTAELEYLTGRTLDEELITWLQQNKREDFIRELKKYIHIVLQSENPNLLDVDIIFKNILVAPDGTWNVLDYEWTFDKEQPEADFVQELTPEFVVYRSMYYFVRDNQLSEEIQQEMFSLIGVTEEDKRVYEELEQRFQRYVSGGHHSLGELYGQYKGQLFYFRDYIQEVKEETGIEFYGLKDGNRMEKISGRHLMRMGDLREIQMDTDASWDGVEVVLGHCDMIADIQAITWNGEDITGSATTNGKGFYQNMYLYLNKDAEPKMVIPLPRAEGNLQIKLMIKEQGDGRSAAFATLYHYLSLKEKEATLVGKIKKSIKRGQ